MRSLLLLLPWIGALISLCGAWTTCTMLIFKLRDRFPVLYAKIGSPNALSRKVDFLSALKLHESEISPDLQRLKRITLVYVGLLISFGFMSVIVAIGAAIAR